jgi:carbon monoxide dehydrogenase subunit G
MSSWKVSVQIAAPPQTVWDTIADYPSAPQWLPKVKSAVMTPEGPLGVGTKVALKRGSITINFTAEEVRPPQFLRSSIVQGKVTGDTTFTLTPDGNGTRVDHTLNLNLKGFIKIFAPFIGGGLKKDMAALKKRSEGKGA